jgi:hypothetical protein
LSEAGKGGRWGRFPWITKGWNDKARIGVSINGKWQNLVRALKRRKIIKWNEELGNTTWDQLRIQVMGLHDIQHEIIFWQNT